MAMKERRITCAACGERETVLRGERGPVSAYCDLCRVDRQRAQARQRMAAHRAARGGRRFLHVVRGTKMLRGHEDRVMLRER